MNFIKAVFKYLFLIIGIGLIGSGFNETNYVLIGFGVLFILPFLRGFFGGKKGKTKSKKDTQASNGEETLKKSGFFSKAFGSHDLQKVIESFLDTKEIIVKDLNENEYVKVLGKNTSIIKKDTILFPMSHELNIKTTFNYSGMAGVFDLRKWNDEMGLHNNALRRNRELKDQHEKLMMEYEKAFQTYQLQEQTRRQTIGNASPKGRSAAFLLTSGARKPKEPTLRQVKVPLAPKDKDDYTNYTDKKTGEGFTLGYDQPLNLVYHSRSLDNFENFNKSYSIKDHPDTIKSIVNSFMKLYPDQEDTYTKQLTKHEINLNIDDKIETKKILVSENDLINNEKETDLNNPSIWDNNILIGLKKLLTSQISEGKINIKGANRYRDIKDIRMKDVVIDVTKLSYKLSDRKFLPLQIIEFNDKKGNKKIEVLDFISKKLIKL